MLFLQLLANGVVVGAQYALVAVGFSIIFSITRVFHVAQGATYVIAGYVFYEIDHSLGLGLIPGLLAALAAAVVFGLAMQEGVYRSVAHARHALFAMFVASFGMVVIVDNIASFTVGDDVVQLLPSLSTQVHVGGVQISRGGLVGLVLAAAIFVGLWWAFQHTRIGVLLRALAADDDLFESAFGHSRRYRRLAFALGSVLAVPGALMVGSVQGLTPSAGLSIGTILIAVTIVGGIGSLSGAAISGLAVGIIQNLVQWKTPVGWDQAVAYGVIVLFMVIRPQGLLKPLRAG